MWFSRWMEIVGHFASFCYLGKAGRYKNREKPDPSQHSAKEEINWERICFYKNVRLLVQNEFLFLGMLLLCLSGHQ